MTQLSNVCGAFPVYNKILLFDGHESRFGDGALRQIMCKNIQPIVLKSGKLAQWYGPNAKVKSLYNVSKSAWMLKYGTKTFSPHHINFILVEAWDAFKMSYGNIIGDRFSKINLLLLSPPNLTKNTHPSIFWIPGWINKQYITPDSWAYPVTSYQDGWYYGCLPSKWYATIIK